MDQTFLNWVLSICGVLGGFWLKSVWDAVKDLQVSDKELANKVSGIAILVAGEYVRRDDLEKISAELFRKLDQIMDKLDKKADK